MDNFFSLDACLSPMWQGEHFVTKPKNELNKNCLLIISSNLICCCEGGVMFKSTDDMPTLEPLMKLYRRVKNLEN